FVLVGPDGDDGGDGLSAAGGLRRGCARAGDLGGIRIGRAARNGTRVGGRERVRRVGAGAVLELAERSGLRGLMLVVTLEDGAPEVLALDARLLRGPANGRIR